MEQLRSVRDRWAPEIPERTVDVHDVERALDEILKERHPHASLKAIVYDERERRLAQARRDLQSGCAATAQRLLPVLNELLTLAGNATWNSPKGVADFAAQRTDDIVREWLEVTRDLDQLRAAAAVYKQLVDLGVEDNLRRRAERPRE